MTATAKAADMAEVVMAADIAELVMAAVGTVGEMGAATREEVAVAVAAV